VGTSTKAQTFENETQTDKPYGKKKSGDDDEEDEDDEYYQEEQEAIRQAAIANINEAQVGEWL